MTEHPEQDDDVLCDDILCAEIVKPPSLFVPDFKVIDPKTRRLMSLSQFIEKQYRDLGD